MGGRASSKSMGGIFHLHRGIDDRGRGQKKGLDLSEGGFRGLGANRESDRVIRGMETHEQDILELCILDLDTKGSEG